MAGRLNPATRGAVAGLAVSGAALAAAELANRRQQSARRKSITAAHNGKAGGSPSRTTRSAAKGNPGKTNVKGKGAKKTNTKRDEHGRYAGSY